MEQLDTFFESMGQFWLQFRDQVPRVIAAFALLLVGWIIARIIEKFAARINR